MRSQVLEWLEPRARRADIDVTIEPAYRLAQREVAGRPRAWTPEVAGEEPVGRPLAATTNGDDPLLHLVVGEQGEVSEVEVGARKPDHVFGLPAREPERNKLRLGSVRDAFPAPEGPHPADPL